MLTPAMRVRGAALRLLVTLLLTLASASAWAASLSYNVFLDTDGSAATGCTVPLPVAPDSFAGAERRLTTRVEIDASGARVGDITRSVCTGGAWGAPVLVSTGGWNVGLGSGLQGSAIVETLLPITDLGAATQVRAAVVSSADALVGALPDFSADPPPANPEPPPTPRPGAITPVPALSPLLLALLAAGIGLTGAWLARRHGAHLVLLGACVLLGAAGMAWAATIVLDGDASDWAGIDPVLSGALGDIAPEAPPGADLVALWVTHDGQNAYFRIDVDIALEAAPEPNPDPDPGSGPGTDPGSGSEPEPTLALGPIADRSIPAGTPWTLLLAADSSQPDAALHYEKVQGPAAAALDPQSLLKWTPGAGDVGTAHPFIVQVSDGAREASASFKVTVTAPANRPPVIAPQPDAQVGAGASFRRTIVATDPDGDAVTLALTEGPAGAALSGNQVTWSTGSGDLGEHFFSVTASDGRGGTSGARFAVRMQPQAAPVAQDDRYAVRLGETLTVAAADGVLANDIEPSGGVLQAEKLTNPAKGTLTALHADGGFTYQAPPSLPAPPPFKMALKLHATDGSHTENLSIADVNGDGVADFVSLWMRDSIGKTRAMSGTDGSSLWFQERFPSPYNDCNSWNGDGSTPVIADIDDDGKVEVVLPVVCYRDSPSTVYTISRVIALDGATGNAKWLSLPLSREARGVWFSTSQLTVARLSPDGPPLIFGGTTIGSFDRDGASECHHIVGGDAADAYCRYVFAFDGRDGTLARSFYAVPPEAPLLAGPNSSGTAYLDSGNYHWPPLVADLDGDGQVDVLYEGTLWRGDASKGITHYDGTRAHVGTSAFAAADLDGDGQAELVLLENTGRRLRALRVDGTPLWDIPAPYCTRQVMCGLALADTDGDGTPEVLLIGDGHLMVYDALGRLRWSHADRSFGPYTLGHAAQPAVYDLDGDGVPEVLLRAAFKVVALRGDTGAELDAFDIYPGGSDAGLQNDPLTLQVVDVDGDGHAEIVTNTPGSFYGGKAGVWVLQSANTPWMPARRRWAGVNDTDGNVDELTGKVAAVPPTPGVHGAANLYGAQRQLATRPDLRARLQDRFTYRALAGGVASDTATVTIDIAPPNSPPRFTSIPPSAAFTGNPLSFQLTAVDSDPGDTITFSLIHTDDLNVTVTPGGQFSRPGRGGSGRFLNIVRATDSQGAYTDLSFVINFTASGATSPVPAVEGMVRDGALAAIANSDFLLGTLDEMFDDDVPTGRVISQTPAADSAQLPGTAIHLILSKGGAPRAVPAVVGGLQSAAGGVLAAKGFVVGATTYAYSSTVERGRVISQSPAAGVEAAPGAVDLVVSGGTGLELALSHGFTSADVPITVTPRALAPDGTPQALPALSYTVTPLATPFAGSLPTVGGGQINAGSATRGAFRISATGGGRTASADFAVGPPAVGGGESPVVEFVQLAQTLQGISDLLVQAEGQDAATAKALMVQAVTRWRGLDRDALRLSSPMTIEGGFLPTPADLAAAGVAPGPQDALNKQLLREGIAPLKALTAGLRARHTPLAELDTLTAAFDAKARLITGLMPSEYGAVLAAPEYALIAGHAIPDLMDALMDDVAEGVGLQREARHFPGLKSAPALHSKSMLVDTLVAMAIDEAIKKISPVIEAGQKYTRDILKQAAWGASAVALAHHAKQFLAGRDLGAVSSGASMSFRVFEAPWAFIEADGLEWEYTDLNTVILIGPDVLGLADPVIEKIKAAWKFNPTDDSGNYKSMGDIKKDLKELKSTLEGLAGATQEMVDNIGKMFQSTDEDSEFCLFSVHPDCAMLVYPDGFESVYHYSGPGGGTGLGGLPVPIVFIVRNNVSGQIFFSTPVFLPTTTP